MAEQQAAEEARRRDPVKRALWAGGILVLGALGWVVMLQMQVKAARSELETLEGSLKRTEESTAQTKLASKMADEIESRSKALDRYATNRFLWANALDAIQHVTVENIRFVDFQVSQKYDIKSEPLDSMALFTTNLTVATPPNNPPFWKFWAAPPSTAQMMTLVSNQFKMLTNKPPFTTNKLRFSTKFSIAATNATDVTAKVECKTAAFTVEHTSLELKCRHYGTSTDAAIDQFTSFITNQVYFAGWLSKTEEAVKPKERPTQARQDPQDPVSPSALFVPFTLELKFRERIFQDE